MVAVGNNNNNWTTLYQRVHTHTHTQFSNPGPVSAGKGHNLIGQIYDIKRTTTVEHLGLGSWRGRDGLWLIFFFNVDPDFLTVIGSISHQVHKQMNATS